MKAGEYITDAEEYLSKARMLNRKIDNKLTELAQLRNMISGISSPTMGDRVQSSPAGDKFGTVIAKIVDMKKEIDTDIDEYVGLKAEIIKTIEKIDDPIGYHILHLYYIQEKSISQIAHELGYTPQSIRRKKKKALYSVQRKLFHN